MANRRKKGKVKKKEEFNSILGQESKLEKKKQNIEDGVKFDDWEKYPGLTRGCRVTLENLDVKQGLENVRKRTCDVLGEVEHGSKEAVSLPSKKSRKLVDKKSKLKGETKEKSEVVKVGKKDKKEDQMFIDFELSKSKRISEIRVLLRGSGVTKQFCSLPPK